MKPLVAGLATLLILLVHITAQPGQAQNAAGTTIVAVVDRLTWPNAQAVIVRDATNKKDLVIMLKTSATSTMLDAALRSLSRRRKISPVPEGREVTVLQSAATKRGSRPAKREKYLGAILEAINDAPPNALRDFGQAQSTTISSLESEK
jgi:hypothetical protein